jgi:hypothetical protein
MWQEVLFWILDKAVLAIFVGLTANGMFLFIISRFRPKIDISQHIAYRLDKNGQPVYRIKVINRTKHPIVDIKAQLHVFRSRQTATGEIWVSTSINFKQSDPIMIDKHDKIDKDANYAYRFVTYENIDNIWNDENIQFLRFRIYAKHSISGFGKFVSKDYRLKRNTIKEGEFSKGDTFEIA